MKRGWHIFQESTEGEGEREWEWEQEERQGRAVSRSLPGWGPSLYSNTSWNIPGTSQRTTHHLSLPLIHRHIHRWNKRWAYEIKSPPSEKEMASVPLFVFGKHSVNQRLGTVATRVVCDSLRSVTHWSYCSSNKEIPKSSRRSQLQLTFEHSTRDIEWLKKSHMNVRENCR